MRIWSYPGIYPYPEGNDPANGIFIHKINKGLNAIGENIKVVQLQDWYPMWPFYHLLSDWKVNFKNRRPQSRVLDGISIYHPTVFSPRPSRFFPIPHAELCVRKLVKFLKQQGVEKGKDVLFAQWLIPDGYIATVAAKRLGISCAVEMQGDDIVVWPHNSDTHMKGAQFVLENADLILGCSDFLCGEAEKISKSKRDFYTIYTGIDLQKFNPNKSTPDEISAFRKKNGINDKDIMILNVGSSIARKGWIELFEVVRDLSSAYPNIKLVGVTGNLKEFDLLEKAAEFGIQHQVIDLGTVSNETLPLVYNSSDIFCLPSHWEGLANSLCEAMASGCAIVTCAVAGHPEIVTHEQNGELIKPKDVAALKISVLKLITDPSLRVKYRISARETALTKIRSHEDNAHKLIKLLRQM